MSESAGTNPTTDAAWFFAHFGLLVTGQGELKFLPKLFQILEKTGVCRFEVIGKVGQRRPVTSAKERNKLRIAGKTIPDKDASEIGLPARKYLLEKQRPNHQAYVILIDDLEHAGRTIAKEIFVRYRDALDAILKHEQDKASVHFLVNMLEAYYFADANALNVAFQLQPILSDYQSDVEEIRHPKNELKQLLTHKYGFNYDEVVHGAVVVSHLDIVHILSEPEHCKSLRTLFTWCIKRLVNHPIAHESITALLRQIDGKLFEVTQEQLNN